MKKAVILDPTGQIIPQDGCVVIATEVEWMRFFFVDDRLYWVKGKRLCDWTYEWLRVWNKLDVILSDMAIYKGNRKTINGVEFGVQSCWQEDKEYYANIFIPVNSTAVYIRITFTNNDANWELPGKGTARKDVVVAENFLRQNLAEIKAFVVELSKHSR